ncbi:hypothetical protein [Castellaniella sp.]|uniref:exodeoxyribonuclease X C-terminal domain-containing protein n=1 Tax=Castellaniella sp. TaxID=1955812 RepID=UPI002AFE0551|nr:hypothetical protein [Castellaniella sp.]
MARHRILHDGIVDFGKHKGKSGDDIVKADPGYLFWCVASDCASIDDALDAAVSEWARRNTKETNRIIAVLKQKGAYNPGGVSGNNPAQAFVDKPKPAPPVTADTNPNWGSW